jgi:hypothetical protein
MVGEHWRHRAVAPLLPIRWASRPARSPARVIDAPDLSAGTTRSPNCSSCRRRAHVASALRHAYERVKNDDTTAAIFLLRHMLLEVFNPNLLLRREALKLEIEQHHHALALDAMKVETVRNVTVDGQEVPVVNNIIMT